MKQRQSGVSSLMMVSLLLVAVLMMTLASYRQAFFQIKRAQNQVQARQQFWQAEGGLECFYAQVMEMGALPSSWHNCGGEPEVVVTKLVIGSGVHQIASAYQNQVLYKNISLGGGVRGAIQTSANLYIRGSTTISVPDPGEEKSAGWECIALTYRNKFESTGGVVNQGVNHSVKPWSSFNSNGKNCLSTHRSAGLPILKDVVKQPAARPFESFFNVPVEEFATVRDSGKFKRLDGVGSPKILVNCGKKITDQINAGHEFIWVEGGCEIAAEQYSELTSATQSRENGVLLVFHDGPLSLMGGGGLFKGSMLHFNTAYHPRLSDWVGFDSYAFLSHVPAEFNTAYINNASFYQHGAFNVSGSQLFDSPDHWALFNTSYNMRFNRDVMEHARSQLAKPRWQKGSWRDF